MVTGGKWPFKDLNLEVQSPESERAALVHWGLRSLWPGNLPSVGCYSTSHSNKRREWERQINRRWPAESFSLLLIFAFPGSSEGTDGAPWPSWRWCFDWLLNIWVIYIFFFKVLISCSFPNPFASTRSYISQTAGQIILGVWMMMSPTKSTKTQNFLTLGLSSCCWLSNYINIQSTLFSFGEGDWLVAAQGGEEKYTPSDMCWSNQGAKGGWQEKDRQKEEREERREKRERPPRLLHISYWIANWSLEAKNHMHLKNHSLL